MLKTGKSYRVTVLDHFSGIHGRRRAPVFFDFVGRYVRRDSIYVVFSLEKDLNPDGQFILPLTEKDKFMYVIVGHFKAIPYISDSSQ
jgi:hypothetical protein